MNEIVKELLEALKEARRAIGDHYAPDDCYATGPLTGNGYRDLVECPACSAIAMYEAVIAKAEVFLAASQPSTDGWIPWAGGKCPIPNGTKYFVRLRIGEEYCDDMAGDWRWNHYGTAGDIIAYRIVGEQP